MGTVASIAAVAVLAPGALAWDTARDVAVSVQESAPATLELESTVFADTDEVVLRGSHKVYEDRDAASGRQLTLDVLVLPARGERRSEPVFCFAGGPGQAATRTVRGYLDSPLRASRDIVFVDQRGTGGDHRLGCELLGSADDPQGYLEEIFDEESFRRCLETLQGRANLRLYTSEIAADDVDEVRRALGYERIHLIGGSYGTRAALVYMRRHGDTVASATLLGTAPVANKNPLFHASGAQGSLERVLTACEDDPECNGAYPKLRAEVATLFERLEKEPATARVRRAQTGEELELVLTRDGFARTLRIMLYSSSTIRRLPRLLHSAFEGDFSAFAQRGVVSSRGLRDQLAFGILACVTCAEDLPRISEEDIVRETAGTFLGDGRVRRQAAVCDFWPRGTVAEDYGAPVTCPAPTLLVSGIFDPVTPPRWGARAAEHLPNSRHVVIERSHDLFHPCITELIRQLQDGASVDDLDTSCVESIRRPRFEVP